MQTKQTEDEDQVLKDGARLTVSLQMMDGTQRRVAHTPQPASPVGHRPGSLPLADAERQRRTALHVTADQKLSARWKHPPALAADTAPVTKPVVQSPPRTAIEAAYIAADRKLSERWRGPAA